MTKEVQHWENENDLSDNLLQDRLSSTSKVTLQTISTISSTVEDALTLASAPLRAADRNMQVDKPVFLHQAEEAIAQYEVADDEMRAAALSWLPPEWTELPVSGRQRSMCCFLLFSHLSLGGQD